ncbi:hypothetical protein CS0771_75790 [Catellatospora sp. IY07-71]|nr:hypothetical protein CS0771_75790 [Catellatospora sp. IY07-71]
MAERPYANGISTWPARSASDIRFTMAATLADGSAGSCIGSAPPWSGAVPHAAVATATAHRADTVAPSRRNHFCVDEVTRDIPPAGRDGVNRYTHPRIVRTA